MGGRNAQAHNWLTRDLASCVTASCPIGYPHSILDRSSQEHHRREWMWYKCRHLLSWQELHCFDSVVKDCRRLRLQYVIQAYRKRSNWFCSNSLWRSNSWGHLYSCLLWSFVLWWKLDHSWINPNQLRAFGIPVWDNPFESMRSLSIEINPMLIISLRAFWTKITFRTRVPTTAELRTCEHI